MKCSIPDPVVKRLPAYCRYLRQLEQEGAAYISSTELGKRMNINPSQIRQDVNCFGGNGRQGYGYPVAELRKQLENVLGIGQKRTMIVVGAGNLGSALMNSGSFEQDGFVTIGVFDSSEQKLGKQLGNMTVQSVDELEAFAEQHPVDIAVLTLPAGSARQMANRLYCCGVRGFWNFAPLDLHLPMDASVMNMHLDESLELLSYWLTNPEALY